MKKYGAACQGPREMRGESENNNSSRAASHAINLSELGRLPDVRIDDAAELEAGIAVDGLRADATHAAGAHEDYSSGSLS